MCESLQFIVIASKENIQTFCSLQNSLAQHTSHGSGYCKAQNNV